MEETIQLKATKIMDSNCVKFIALLDSQITRNIKNADIQTREAKSNGLWCCTLLPIILITYSVQYAVSPLYKLVAFASVGLLFYCLLFIVFLSISCLVLQESIYGGCIASSLVSALLMFSFLEHNLTFAAIFSVPSVFMFSWLLRTCLNIFPKTFTIGEAMVMVQAVVLFTVMAVAKITCNLDESDEEMNFIYTIIYTVLSTVGLIVTALFLLKDEQRTLTTLGYIVATGAAFALLMLIIILGIGSPFRILKYIFIDNDRYKLFTFWLILLALSVGALTARTRLAVKASTVTRKVFHVLGSLVFLSGILLDERLMTLAAGIVFGLMVLVEALRKANIEPISSALQSAFLVYSDEKDSGYFAMTPIYLYLGLSCPLALVPRAGGAGGPGAGGTGGAGGAGCAGCALARLAGVLAVGVGDTAASWFGSKYGFNKWSGGNRTYEGTAFNILSQVATVYALVLFELLNAKNAVIRTVIAASATALVEARTSQVDNLVLPLVMLLAFQATWFLQ